MRTVMCVKLGVIAGNALFVDGTKIRAIAAGGKTYDRAQLEKRLAELDRRVEKLIEESEREDQQEEGLGSNVEVSKELVQAEELKKKIQQGLEALKENGKQKVNLTDRDCALMHSVQGSHASYNLQSVVDGQHGLIVHAEAVSESSDINQFANRSSRPTRFWINAVRWRVQMQATQIRRSLKRSTIKESRWWFLHSVKPYIRLQSFLAKGRLSMIRKKTATSALSKTSWHMSTPTTSGAGNIIGSASREFVAVVFIMGSAPRTRMAAESCD